MKSNLNLIDKASKNQAPTAVDAQNSETKVATQDANKFPTADSQSKHDGSHSGRPSIRSIRATIAKYFEWIGPRIRPHNSWIPAINVLALIVIFAQAMIYYQQRRVMNQQSEFMKTQTEIMKQSLAISQQTLLDNQQTFRISERAYVGIANVTTNLKAGDTNLKAGEIQILLQNIGHVPAKAIKLDGQEIRAMPTEDGHRGSVFHREAGEVQLFPGTPMPFVISSFKPDEVNAILSKKENLYIGGTIQYEDGFGNNESTTFAFRYDPSNDRWIAHPDLSRFFKRNER
jgi:hypothetical protein